MDKRVTKESGGREVGAPGIKKEKLKEASRCHVSWLTLEGHSGSEKTHPIPILLDR